MMDIYVYLFRNDSSQEPVGRVQASGMFDARKQVGIIKKLDTDLVDHLFIIKKLSDHEQQNRKNTR
tara:strand:+ start:5697 stop:5894 length:198 start_codon:yes stop_codon:yes gene_type:complete